MRQKLVFLVLLGFLAYIPFVRNQLFWDDEQFIYNNEYVKSFAIEKIFTTNTIAGAGESSNYYRPLTTLSFAIDYQFWGLNPIGFRLVNAILHTAAGVILFLIFLELGLKKIPSLGLASIFLVHPLQTEAVSYANSRGDSFYTFLGLIGLYFFLRLLRNRPIIINIYDLNINLNQNLLGFGSISFYLLSILAKEIGIAIVGLYALVLAKEWLEKKRVSKFALTSFILSVVTGLTYLALRFTALKFESELNLFGESSLYGNSITVRLLTFTKVIWVYIKLLLAPYPLHMERDVELVTSLVSIWPWLSLGLVILIFWLGLKELKNKKSTWIWLGACWMIIPLLPVSGIFPINGILYEHWLYLPQVGWWLMIYGVLLLSFGKFWNKKIIKQVFGLALGIWLILTWRQNYIWANPIRFYNYTLGFAQTARLHNNLAMAYADQNNLDKAISHYQRSIEISDIYPQTHFNLGNAYIEIDELEQAEREFLRAIELSPGFFLPYRNLVVVYFNQQKFTEALEVLSQAETQFGNLPTIQELKAIINNSMSAESLN